MAGLQNREYGRRDPSRWPHDTLYQQKLALTSPTGGGRWIGIVRSRTQATEFFYDAQMKELEYTHVTEDKWGQGFESYA
jgi:hypothetical protein